MRVIRLDASTWTNVLDFYEAILAAVEAPEWHGRNLNALYDSMIGGMINGVEPPYRIEIAQSASMPLEVETEIALAAWIMAVKTPWENGEPLVSIIPARR
jgi:RNAse (barnase) inhibitor barstar